MFRLLFNSLVRDLLHPNLLSYPWLNTITTLNFKGALNFTGVCGGGIWPPNAEHAMGMTWKARPTAGRRAEIWYSLEPDKNLIFLSVNLYESKAPAVLVKGQLLSRHDWAAQMGQVLYMIQKCVYT